MTAMELMRMGCDVDGSASSSSSSSSESLSAATRSALRGSGGHVHAENDPRVHAFPFITDVDVGAGCAPRVGGGRGGIGGGSSRRGFGGSTRLFFSDSFFHLPCDWILTIM